MNWFIYFAAAFGFSYIIGIAQISHSLRVLLGGVDGHPAQPAHVMFGRIIPAQEETPTLRPLIPVVGPFIVDLIECPACSGFWIGVASSFWLPVLFGSNPVLWALVMGCATSGMNYFISGIVYRDHTR